MSKKREQLLERSERLFETNGFHAVGIKQLIKEADISLMTLYNHFDSKEKLILAILQRREIRYMQLLKQAFVHENVDVLSIVNNHINWIEKNGANGCMFLRAKEEFSAGVSENQEITTFATQHKQRLVTLFNEQGLTKREAMRLVLVLEGATAMAEVFDLDDVVEETRLSIQALFSS
ncbi:TetR/AcrR family transcriptional regulator [Shouchella sp. 1P09AA]|uniref:TetR/AcrR family transcriptional regulator n=1 Tax=unclassified Shouchella TaxID=2893065 RepID=UPI0039A321E5